MLSIFLGHQWKSFWRGRNKSGAIVTRIIMGFFILYFIVLALAAGFFMEKIIHKTFPTKDPITVFNGFMLYYFMVMFLVRIQLQELPTMSIVPYLHLNISRNKIINFLNVKSLFSVFNVLPLIIFLPFSLTLIAQAKGTQVGFLYVVIVLSMMVLNNFLVLYLKRKSIGNVLYVFIGIAVVAGFAALEYFKIISLASAADIFLRSLSSMPWLALGPVLIALFIFYINSAYLRKNLYVEELSKKSEKKVSTDYPFLNRFGEVGALAALELKLILRHKRSRTSLIMGFLFLVYGFLFYKPEMINANKFSYMLFAAIFMTGIFLVTYGQFMFAWQSAHFDGLMANRIDFKKFIKAKFLLFTISSTLITLLSVFYGFLSWKLVVMQFAVYFYIIGFGTVLVLFMACLNYKRLDITKSASFNWQGTSAVQMIMAIPLLLIPFLIYMPFGIYNLPFAGLAAIALFGIINLFLRNIWVNYITNRFARHRYKIAEGFRQ
ncbi:MAG: hypothetical protein JSS98_14405 [Bacteroidetes bacterium]|nr:hypothetical protein [Bacteroidota bacterium]